MRNITASSPSSYISLVEGGKRLVVGEVEGPNYRHHQPIGWVDLGGPKFIGVIGTVRISDACSDEMDRMWISIVEQDANI